MRLVAMLAHPDDAEILVAGTLFHLKDRGWDLGIVTMTAGYQKIFSANPRLGFLSHANLFETTLAAGNLPAGVASAEAAQRFILNDRIDAAVAAFFMISVIIIIADSAKEWYKVVSGRMPAISTEVPFEPRAVVVAGD